MDKRLTRTSISLAALLALGACGGGGSSDDGSSSSSATPASADVTITGTAATDAGPLAGATVDVKCATGNGSASTANDGRYSVVVAGATRPCVLRVANGASALHGLVESGSGNASANLTPLTELVTAEVAGGSPEAYYTTFDGAAQAKADAASVAKAKAGLGAALKSKVDLTGLDPLTGTAASGTPLDQRLDTLATTLAAARLTLSDLASALAANPGSPAPVETIIQTSSAACAGLRSGRYRAIDPFETDPAFNTQVIEVDAAALSLKDSDGTTNGLVDAGTCSFTTPEGTLLVAPSGLGVFRSSVSPSGFAVLIPEQALTLAELAGTWNYVAYDRDASNLPFTPSNGYFTLDAAGKVSNHFECLGRSACSAASAGPDLAASTAGGFQIADASGTERFFAYKTAGGGITAVVLQPGQRGISIATRQVARALPAIGDVTKNRSFTVNSGGTNSVLSADETRTVTSVDTAAQSYLRARQADGAIDGFAINSPRTGLFYRPASVSPINGGGTVNISEIVLLPLPGGASVFTSATAPNNFFGLSVNHP